MDRAEIIHKVEIARQANRRPDLRRLELDGLDLQQVNLSEADFHETSLFRANLAEADLHGSNLVFANLIKASLRGANLQGANLVFANLRLADLSGADLSGANLSAADLQGANLSRAKLPEARLHEANLRETDLREADISKATLTLTDLTEANLTQANLCGADLRESNLSQAPEAGCSYSRPLLPGLGVEQVGRRAGGERSHQVFRRQHAHFHARGARGGADVRREHDVGHPEQAIVQRRFILEYVERRAGNGKYFMSYVVKEKDDHGQYFPDQDLTEHLTFLMFAAHDTTTSALSHLIMLLGQHPEIKEKVREELQGLNKDHLSYDDLDKLVYTEQAFLESQFA